MAFGAYGESSLMGFAKQTKCCSLLTFQHFQEVLGHIPTDCLKVGKLEEVWGFQTTLHFITPANQKTSHQSVMTQTGNKPTINGVIFCARQSVSPELHADIEVVKEVPSKRHAILRGENSMDPACRGRKSTRFVMGTLCARIATMPFPAETDGLRSSATTTVLTQS